jgi:hypothetical protein
MTAFLLKLSSGEKRLRRDAGADLRIKVAVARPHCPDDAREFVGHCNRGLVVAATRGNVDGPSLQARRLTRGRSDGPLRPQQDGASPMRQEAAQIDIPAFADSAEMAPSAAGRLPGRQTQPARKVPAATKRVNVPDSSDAVMTPTPGI